MRKVRYTLNLTEEVSSVLEKLALKEGCCKSEVIRKSLGVYDYIRNELKRGEKLAIIKKDRIIREVYFF